MSRVPSPGADHEMAVAENADATAKVCVKDGSLVVTSVKDMVLHIAEKKNICIYEHLIQNFCL